MVIFEENVLTWEIAEKIMGFRNLAYETSNGVTELRGDLVASEGEMKRVQVPNYACDHLCMWGIEGKLKNMGLEREYISSLAQVLGVDPTNISLEALFPFIHASTMERAEAAVRTIRGLGVS